MAQSSLRLGSGVYSPKLAARIARIKYQSFQAWAKANLLRAEPFRLTEKRSESTYTYKDLLLIRLIVRLKRADARPKAIRAALDTLEYVSGRGDAWMRATIAVQGNVVVALLSDHPDANPLALSKGPQKGLHVVFFPELIKELQEELLPPGKFPYIEIDPTILGGVPVIKDTRISTRAIASVRESGIEPSLAYPNLTSEQIANAEQYERFLEQAA